MDWVVRKAVELGAAAIAPVIAARSNAPGGSRAERRLAHWRSIAIAACEQCGRNRIPPIAQSQPLLQWLDACNGREPAAMLAPGAAHSLAALARERDLRYVVVGPEGGFTESELALADRHGIARAHLGSRTLRSETAAAAALATIEAVAGEPA
jgi:16S rRNA (uracil1498-N3)-methyltransferase